MGAEQRIGDNIRVAASEFAAAELENEIGSWTALLLLLVSSLKKNSMNAAVQTTLLIPFTAPFVASSEGFVTQVMRREDFV